MCSSSHLCNHYRISHVCLFRRQCNARSMTRIPLEMLHVRNPPNRKTEIHRYKFKPKSQFESVLRDSEESELLDMIDLGGVVLSVETVIYHCLSLCLSLCLSFFLPPAYLISLFLAPLAEVSLINAFKFWKN